MCGKPLYTCSHCGGVCTAGRGCVSFAVADSGVLQADMFMDEGMHGGSKRQQRETRVDFHKVLKMASHADVVELYLFVLQRYKTLDAQTLHAITSFLTRVCDKLNLEPMLYQV